MKFHLYTYILKEKVKFLLKKLTTCGYEKIKLYELVKEKSGEAVIKLIIEHTLVVPISEFEPNFYFKILNSVDKKVFLCFLRQRNNINQSIGKCIKISLNK